MKARNLNLLAVGTGFSEKLLSTLFSKLNKIRVEKCPFYNLPAFGRSRWDQGLTAAEMKRCHWVKPAMVCHSRRLVHCLQFSANSITFGDEARPEQSYEYSVTISDK